MRVLVRRRPVREQRAREALDEPLLLHLLFLHQRGLSPFDNCVARPARCVLLPSPHKFIYLYKFLSLLCFRALTCCSNFSVLPDSRRAMLRHFQLLLARFRRARHSNGHFDRSDPVLLPIHFQQIRILLFISHRASSICLFT